jgi:glycosyltransferase involved in cell wall biosynthesis
VHIAVLIPAFNEARWVAPCVERLIATPPPRVNESADAPACERTIIIVNDGSTDNTRDIIDALAAKHPTIRVIHQPRNQGKGAALATAIAEALRLGVDAAIIHDADLEYDPRDHDAILRPIIDARADAVIGSRFLGQTHRVLYYWHSVANKFITTFSNMVSNLNLTDIECCSKAFSRKVLEQLAITERGFGVEPELVARLSRMRLPDNASQPAPAPAAPMRPLRIYEVPVSYSGRTYAEGKKIHWTDGVEALVCIIKHGIF